MNDVMAYLVGVACEPDLNRWKYFPQMKGAPDAYERKLAALLAAP
jgi:hypothetical protein